MDILVDILIILILLQLVVPIVQRRIIVARRRRLIQAIERKRGSRVITLLHRQEILSLLGFPITRFITIEDSEQILRAIRLTPDVMPIDIILHTPGGLVLAAEQIALALRHKKGKVTILVPHYAMSGGTLLALAADEIVMDPGAVLGPVDPQLGSPTRGYRPAVSILKALDEPNPNRDDETLILGDIARKAVRQIHELVLELVEERFSVEKAEEIASALTEGRWTHDYPITVAAAKELGLPVTDEMPDEIYRLMDLYPQAGPRRPSVEYIPLPYPPGKKEEEKKEAG